MKRADYIVLGSVAFIALALACVPEFLSMFQAYTKAYGYLLSFLKFAVLATFGECVALRVVEGSYWRPGFGLIAKAIVWGFLGLFIKAAFVVFATGTPQLLASLRIVVGTEPDFADRLVVAFAVSLMLNTIFAPVLMVLHKILDDHIHKHHGRLSALIAPVAVRERLEAIDWTIMWGLVIRKTIPLFWIPAHTVTFMLPSDMRILFAAILGGVLGVILAFASLSSRRASG